MGESNIASESETGVGAEPVKNLKREAREELGPKEFAARDEIPPRRTGYNIIVLICGLLAALFFLLYISLWVCDWRTELLIDQHMRQTVSLASTDAQHGLSKEEIDRIIQYNDSSRKGFFDFTEKVGLALISLLSAVVGYTLKGEATASVD